MIKARRKPYMTKKNKEARLRWAREHLGWTLEDWMQVIWTDEATFETGLDSRICYVTRKPGTSMDSRYLKSRFKSHCIGEKGSGSLFDKGRSYNLENLHARSAIL